MKIQFSSAKPEQATNELLVIPIVRDHKANPEVQKLDVAVGGHLLREARRSGFSGMADERFVFQTQGRIGPRLVLLYGCGPQPDTARWYQLSDTIIRTLRELRCTSAFLMLGESATNDIVSILAEGLDLASYRFTRFRSDSRDIPEIQVAIGASRPSEKLRQALTDAQIKSEATLFARDLINLPASVLTPVALAQEARKLAKNGLTVRVHDLRGLQRLGMGALLGVGQGSAQEPRFIEVHYKPAGAKKSIALVGKGITFDSGGLSLKNADAMRTQKRDMSGAALVLGVMSALPALAPQIEVRGYIPTAENMPSGTAIRPGDVLRAMNGKTIEVLNTDAEGRLVLADGLSYAARAKPDLIIDFATLTAAVTAALGTRCAAVMGSDSNLVRSLIESATRCGERLWELPLIEDYRRDIDSHVADLKNVGEGHAGTIIGGLFLREFTDGLPWAHVDFSSTAFTNGFACHPHGATGFGVRTVLRLIETLAA